MLRVESGLFYHDANPVHARIRRLRAEDGHARRRVFDAETVPYVDVTAAEMLAAFANPLDHEGVRLAIAGQRRARARRAPSRRPRGGRRALLPTVDPAVADLEAPS